MYHNKGLEESCLTLFSPNTFGHGTFLKIISRQPLFQKEKFGKHWLKEKDCVI